MSPPSGDEVMYLYGMDWDNFTVCVSAADWPTLDPSHLFLVLLFSLLLILSSPLTHLIFDLGTRRTCKCAKTKHFVVVVNKTVRMDVTVYLQPGRFTPR